MGLTTTKGLFAITVACLTFTINLMPATFVRNAVCFITSRYYRLRVYQLDKLPASGGVLLLGNHISFIDWAVLQSASPRPIRFVIDRSYYQLWYLTKFFKKFGVIPIAQSGSQNALQEINKALNAGEVVALFPEGRLSSNGQMGIFRSGFERSAMNAKAVIIPFYLHGLWGSKTSHASRYNRKVQANRRAISVTYGTAMDINSSAQTVRQSVKHLSIKAWQYSIQEKNNIQTEWLLKAKKIMRKTAIIERNGKRISVAELLGTLLFLSKKLKPHLKNQQNIGIMLPASTGGILANLCVLFLGKTVVNLNYTTDEISFEFVKNKAAMKTIISSRPFVTKLEARGTHVLSPGVQVIYLEDLITKNSKSSLWAYTALAKNLPVSLLKRFFSTSSNINSTAAIIFSSREGGPKEIQLSHANILSNINQLVSVMDLERKDVMLNSLPLYHAFGLTMTTLLPLLKGVPVVCCPDPTKAVEIAKLIFKHKVTLFCSTSTLLGLYTRNAAIHPRMLNSLRLVIAGEEQLSPVVSEEFKDKFNLDIYEGYGVAEVAPVASCNLPDAISTVDWHIHKASKAGTVGMPLPGCAFRVVDSETLEDLPLGENGLIFIGSIQLMPEYSNSPDKIEEAVIDKADYYWYKTGDRGHLDSEGFLTIVDRYSSFTKVAGFSQAEQIMLTPVLDKT